MYDYYQCNVYYKMKVDLSQNPMSPADSMKFQKKVDYYAARDSARGRKKDTADFSLLDGNNHLLFSETFSRRSYKRPQQLQEEVIASRFSGLKKTYFTNLVTDVLPFHVYSDYIYMNGKDYINPVAKGWQQRYEFRLYDEISDGNDTTFILSFSPKAKTSFNSLSGLVYVNSKGYAISHFIGNSTDTVSNRDMRIEQVYTYRNGHWFPRELNYDLIFKKYPSPVFSMKMNGHSIIDSISFQPLRASVFDKAHPVKLSDSVDLRTAEDWKRFRMDSITIKEMNTYRIIDSLSEKAKIEKLVYSFGKLALGRLPIGKLDLDITRLFARNEYEGSRIGLGFFTNDSLSQYYSVGAWMGYGLQDKVMKFGGSFTLYPWKGKDNWLRFAAENDYQNTGNISIHPDIDRDVYRNWLISQADHIKEYRLTAHTQAGYWELEGNGLKQDIETFYANQFVFDGKNLQHFKKSEAGLTLRYAYGEKRVPVFGYYFSTTTKYPRLFLRSAIGNTNATGYSANYITALAAIDFTKRINRWGNDRWRIEAGILRSFDKEPIPRSFLMASKGFARDAINFYGWGGFLTMHAYDFYNDAFVSVLYKHDFDKFLWNLRFSKPFVSIAHNMTYGNLESNTKTANINIAAPVSGYHESGLILNQLLQKNIYNVSYLYLNIGAFYHWTSSFDWGNNGVFVIGVSAGF